MIGSPSFSRFLSREGDLLEDLDVQADHVGLDGLQELLGVGLLHVGVDGGLVLPVAENVNLEKMGSLQRCQNKEGCNGTLLSASGSSLRTESSVEIHPGSLRLEKRP